MHGIEDSKVQFHLLSFEGPDAYARAGGLASRVEGLTRTLAELWLETHLWFIGDPDQAGHEHRDPLHLHRWAQWVSRFHPGGVYDGEVGKANEYSTSLPPYLMREAILPHAGRGGRVVVLAEEWHTVQAVLHLHELLVGAGIRDQVRMLWNANNTFGFEAIPWDRLREAAVVTTVSRYMKHRMRAYGVDPVVIPNGLPTDAFDPADRHVVAELRRRFRDRTLLAKMARWHPDKGWMQSLEIAAALKRERWRPLMLVRGGAEPFGGEVLGRAHALGLQVVEREWRVPGATGLLGALGETGNADLVNLRSHVDPDARRVLLRAVDAVLANSSHEPFGLVGLETMAAGGVACTGCSGEDYAVPGQNALVLETSDPREFVGLYGPLRADPQEALRLRRAGQSTSRRYAWRRVVEGALLPRVQLA
jgi:glycosyltransferase involved in cell wall biosynthesis